MTHPDLRHLAEATDARPPFAFEEFERRRAVARGRQRATVWSVAASVGVLGLVALLALMTQRPEAIAVVSNGPDSLSEVPATTPYEPAVVDLRQFAMTSDLEDHIAMLDAQISAARVYAASPDRLRQMEHTRAQLNESLQRVSYAQTLLSF